MLRYSPAAQLAFDDFDVPSLQKLDPANRWVVMADIVPWDDLALVFAASPTAPKLNGPGRPTCDLRLVMGALLVQHLEALSDERTLELIRENVYVQFFCGLPGFRTEAPFDASSLTHWRAWLGDAGAAALSETLADVLEARRREETPQPSRRGDDDAPGPEGTPKRPETAEPALPASADNQGTLLLDATCAPADVRYPTDTALLDHARRSLEQIVDVLWTRSREAGCAPDTKPRTYRERARGSFAAFSRRRRPSRRAVRRERRRQLQYVERDLGHVDALLDGLLAAGAHEGALAPAQYKRLLVCRELARQQRGMHDARARRCDDRIVSLAQPHVRPIVRGKAGARVEFGPKLDVSLSEGIARVECVSCGVRELRCLSRRLHRDRGVRAVPRAHVGHYPAKVLVDRAYLSRANRRYFKARGIRYVARPQGRPPKDPVKLAAYDAALAEAERPGERNPIEGFFGLAKRRYRLGRLQCRRAATTIGEVFLVTMAVNLAGEFARVSAALLASIAQAYACLVAATSAGGGWGAWSKRARRPDYTLDLRRQWGAA